MKKGFTITYDNNRKKDPWNIKFHGDDNMVGSFDFGDGSEPILRCEGCKKVHWTDLKYEKN